MPGDAELRRAIAAAAPRIEVGASGSGRGVNGIAQPVRP
jgi:hypothetical protein